MAHTLNSAIQFCAEQYCTTDLTAAQMAPLLGTLLASPCHCSSLQAAGLPTQVLVLAFGENFPAPGTGSPLAEQAFAVAIAGAGLVSFALVLALVEQVVLENVEENVKRGSPIVASGHVRTSRVRSCQVFGSVEQAWVAMPLHW